MRAEQLPLFPQRGAKGEYGAPLIRTPDLTSDSSLKSAVGEFDAHMVREGFTENTRKAFHSDLRLLMRYLGGTTSVSEVSTKHLRDFLVWLLDGRGVPCSPKSYARRVTTLKRFFAWLTEAGVIAGDPAAPIPHQPADTPLPDILYDSQVEDLLSSTQALMNDPDHPDARPHLLVRLLLETGIKKGECVRIALDHIDRSDPSGSVLYVRYDNPRMRKKERKLALSPKLVSVLDRYLAEYEPQTELFECTARNLEYVLNDAGTRAGIDHIAFEMLRWTSAVRDYRAGMDPEDLRQKLGLSPITWVDALQKIEILAGPAL
ncbi:MAG: tyrosine-type recombinase/integrase [Anaerolineae bacterium]